MIQTRAEFRFENPVLVPAQGLFTPYWMRALGGLAILVNTLIASRNTGVTAAVASGTVISHGLPQTPKFVTLTPTDGTPTNVYADSLTATSFTLNYTGGGAHSFGWTAET